MSLLISAYKISKEVGSKALFENLSLGIQDKEKVGLIGPNGAGKSTLLKIFSGEDQADEGEIQSPKGLRVSFVEQNPQVDESLSAFDFIFQDLLAKKIEKMEAEIQANIALSLAGFTDTQVLLSNLSGGWKKRAHIACATAYEPDLLILDEPTNHMDWEGLFWLETYLKSFNKSFILVSHDRSFLNQVTNRTIEINPMYQEGYLSFNDNYEKFLEHKKTYVESQMKLEQSLGNKARRELDWLRAGVKARTTKSQSRIDKANSLLGNLDDLKKRNQHQKNKSRFEIDSSQRKTKKLVELKNLSVGFKTKSLVKDLSLSLGPKRILGLLGHNGSGKTSLLKAITADQNILSGSVFRAENLKLVYFDQKREDLPLNSNLMTYLGEGSDYVIFKEQSVHVASYASRFLFTSEKMQMKISRLSGGEQARLLIAKLLLQPADVLVLDEPTNDLDIETIEILEESLNNFAGLVLLVSHDRQFLKNLCDNFLALSGQGDWASYASIKQWLKAQKTNKSSSVKKNKESADKTSTKHKLSYKEKKQLETIESDIKKAEANLEKKVQSLQDPSLAQDAKKFASLSQEVESLQNKVNDLYITWDDLEKKS